MHVVILISSEVVVLLHYFIEKIEMYAHSEWIFRPF